MNIRSFVVAFIGGFLSTLAFHQGLFAILYLAGVLPIPPYNMNPTQPFGVPAVISLAFFGGVWGIVLWPMLKNSKGKKLLLKSILFGAIGPTLFAFTVVFPLKGITFNPLMIPFGFLLNGAWGLGLALALKYSKRQN